MKIKKDDKVLIISGKDRGRIGKVLRVFPKKQMILVEEINLRKKHMRPRRGGEKGQIISRPAPFHIGKAKILCPKCAKPARIGYKIAVEGKKKYRICKKCGQEI